MPNFKIFHNPHCSKSRQALALLQENGIQPEIVEYLKTPPTKKEISEIIKLLGITPQELMRKNEDDYLQANLADPSLSTKQQIELMVAYPKVIERPIVVGNGKAAIGRPPENVLKII